MKFLTNCLNILKENEGIIGHQALRHISYLLILKLLEPNISQLNLNLNLNDTKLLYYSNLINDEDIINNINYLWEHILSKNSITKNIFLYNFNIKNSLTYKKLFNELNFIILDNIDYDLLGNIYEKIVESSLNEHKSLNGQFFTPPIIKNIMIDLINPNIDENGYIETCCDPTMGTGGLLISYLKYILNKAKEKKIKPNWNFIINEGLCGKEIDLHTYQLSLSNFLISFGYLPNLFFNGNSIYEPILKQFDNIIANPPYGIKSLNYNNINNNLKKTYYPFETNDSVSLFLQSIIYMLKINGKCSIVLPVGQNLYSKTNKTLINIREYLMKTCDLKEVIYLPSRMFTYTLLKSCIFYFVKKIDCIDILNKQSIKHQTISVKFYEYICSNNTKKLLIDVPIDKIANNFYSLNYIDYDNINNENININQDDNIIQTLNNLFYIKTNTTNYVNTNCSINFNNKLLLLKNDEMKHYLEYIAYLLNTYSIENNKKNYNLKELNKLKIIIPTNVEIQNKIINYIKNIYNINNINYNKINQLNKLNDSCIELSFINNIYKEINDVCISKNGKKIIRKNLIQGEYYVIGGGKSPMGYHNEYNIDENTVLCSLTGTYSGYISMYNKKAWITDCFAIIPKDNNTLNNMYLYYILKNLQNKIYKLQKGTAQPHLYYSDLKYLKIPIPPINKQIEICEYIKNNNNIIINLENEINCNKKEILNCINLFLY